MRGWEKLINSWEESMFTEAFYLLCELIAFVAFFLWKGKDKFRQYFLIYILLDLSVLIFIDLIYFFPALKTDAYKKIKATLNGSISLIEVFLYYRYFFVILKETYFKKFFSLIQIVYLMLFILYTIIIISNTNPKIFKLFEIYSVLSFGF